jgi:hypothetical protein
MRLLMKVSEWDVGLAASLNEIVLENEENNTGRMEVHGLL